MRTSSSGRVHNAAEKEKNSRCASALPLLPCFAEKSSPWPRGTKVRERSKIKPESEERRGLAIAFVRIGVGRGEAERQAVSSLPMRRNQPPEAVGRAGSNGGASVVPSDRCGRPAGGGKENDGRRSLKA
ncbi:unnamed protein product, partial [Musa acuminata subsp. burmannicoides]